MKRWLQILLWSLPLFITVTAHAQCFDPPIPCVQYDYFQDSIPKLANNTERLLDYIARNITGGGGGGGGGLATEATLELVADATSDIDINLYNPYCSESWLQSIFSQLHSPNAPAGTTCNSNYSLLNLIYTEWSATLADSLKLTNQILRGIGSGGSTTGLATEATQLNVLTEVSDISTNTADIVTNTTGLATQSTLNDVKTNTTGLNLESTQQDIYTLLGSMALDLSGIGSSTADINTNLNTVTATQALQTTGNNYLATINTNVNDIENYSNSITTEITLLTNNTGTYPGTTATNTGNIATSTASSATSDATTATQTTNTATSAASIDTKLTTSNTNTGNIATSTATTATNTGNTTTQVTTLNNNSSFTTVSTGALGVGGAVDYSNANGAPINDFSFTCTSAMPATYTITVFGSNDNTIALARWLQLDQITNATAATALHNNNSSNITGQNWKYIRFVITAVAAGTITSTVVWKSHL